MGLKCNAWKANKHAKTKSKDWHVISENQRALMQCNIVKKCHLNDACMQKDLGAIIKKL